MGSSQRKELEKMLSEQDRDRLEDAMLASEMPEDAQAVSVSQKMKKSLRKGIGAVRRASIYAKLIMTMLVVITILLFGILITQVKISDKSSNAEDQQQEAINGFDALVIENKQSQEKDADIINDDQQKSGSDSDDAEESNNPYYICPEMEVASPQDSMIQIGSSAYKIPVELNKLEENGISLVMLGTQPPNDQDILDAGTRDGYLQFEGQRYQVTLKNGTPCTYHELTVIAINIDEPSSIYVFGGLTVGSEEAAIPADLASKIETDAPFKVKTYYKFGELTKNDFTGKNGKQTVITTSNRTGKIESIEIFNDGTVADNEIK